MPMPAWAQRRDILHVTLRKHVAESPETPIDPRLLAPIDPRLLAPAPASGDSSDAPSYGSPTGSISHSGSDGGSGGEAGDSDPLSLLAASTEGLSGSDLVQLCSEAARLPMQEHLLAVETARDAAAAWCASPGAGV